MDLCDVTLERLWTCVQSSAFLFVWEGGAPASNLFFAKALVAVLFLSMTKLVHIAESETVKNFFFLGGGGRGTSLLCLVWWLGPGLCQTKNSSLELSDQVID